MTRIGRRVFLVVAAVGAFCLAAAITVAVKGEHRYDVWAPLVFGALAVAAVFTVWLLDVTVRSLRGLRSGEPPDEVGWQ